MDVATIALFAAILMSLIGGIVFAVLDVATFDDSATQRAESLLRSHLSNTEMAELQQSGVLEVRSPGHAARVYQISAYSGRATVQTDGLPEYELCIHTRELLPGREHLLAHQLRLEGAV